MITDMSEVIEVGKKLQFFLNTSKAIHIDTKSGRFYNGFIQEIGADFVILNEFVLGETIIFFIEIEVLQPWVNKKKE